MPKTDIKHFSPKKQKFEGIYRGVIENNNDPEKMGRVKVRIYGIHTENNKREAKEGVPVDDLSWAEPCLGLVEGSISGYGAFSVPLQGSHVFVFFEGGNWQSPRYFATVPGKPTEAPDSQVGFNDPDEEYPVEHRIDEPDYHRLSRGDKNETVVQHRNENLDTGVALADGETWDEPESAYAAEYPHNIVLSTHGGIVVELDSTPGSERIHVFHPSNTYIEIDQEGNVVFRNEGTRFDIVRGERNSHTIEDDNETIDASKTKNVSVDETIQIGSNKTEDVGGDVETTIGGSNTTDVGSSEERTIGSSWTVSAGTTAKLEAGATFNITAGGVVTIKGSSVVLKGASKTLTVA